MRTYLDCVPCFIGQALDSARRRTDSPTIQEQLLREALTLASKLSFAKPPPIMGRLLHRRLRELTGQPDPYRTAKHKANQFALRLYPELKELVIQSEDPLGAAAKFAIAGNVIDLGVKTGLTQNDVRSSIQEAIEGHLEPEALEDFRQAVKSAGDILYLADNAGEIVFDCLLIEQMPPGSVTVAVKAGPIINDATREDAEAAGLTDLVEVIDSGDDAPGTVLDLCSPSFRRRFDAAHLVIAKGQGNYETLNECRHRNLFFLLKAKCGVIARDLGCRVGEMVVRRHETFAPHHTRNLGESLT
ncbi:MAG TPA: ARMT1-like domain-containing protein [Phycisphaerae bacterium]|nr:ARMT1-like domain-containing protein [Phycisphaerae bacterium]HRY69799.1 ARMT1-like domain-containing protein [Phycisphaerae bacterium]HSA25368.1 ARMT1-like domain-containing protein [Phycisphaerae bacterium]